MSRLIDADALRENMQWCIDHGMYDKPYDYLSEIDDAPTIDAVDVVRCRDCKHRYGDECPMRHIEWVEYEEDGFMERDDIVHDHTVDDGFCNCGEREGE